MQPTSPLKTVVVSTLATALLIFVAQSLIGKQEIRLGIAIIPILPMLFAVIIGILICLPETPVRGLFIDAVAKISFLSCCVPLLAFAGLSVGGQLEELKKMSWKVILIFMVVSTCCFFGASLVAQLGFSIQGII